MTEPEMGRIPWLLHSIRRQADQLLEQTDEVEEWIAGREATYEVVVEHLYDDLCGCDTAKPALCDKHASIMLMVGGPMDGETLFYREAGRPLPEIMFALPKTLDLLPHSDPNKAGRLSLPRARYQLAAYLRGRDGLPSRVWTYTCAYADSPGQSSVA